MTNWIIKQLQIGLTNFLYLTHPSINGEWLNENKINSQFK
jgi:hypothetical protein